MNKLTIIGNLTNDPELRTTAQGVSVCTFGVAVNRRRSEGTDFFRVSAWRALGENCKKYLEKGRKVAVTGSVSVSVYKLNGEPRANLEVSADDVEFLSSQRDGQLSDESKAKLTAAANELFKKDFDENGNKRYSGYEEVTGDELPWT